MQVWIDVLVRAGAVVETCHVSEPGQSEVKPAKKAKQKTHKPKSKSKVKEEPLDSDSEDEPALESEDDADELNSSQYQYLPTVRRETRTRKRAADDDELPTLTSPVESSPAPRRDGVTPRKKRRVES